MSEQRGGDAYFRLEWKLAVDRSHLMAEERTFLVPIVIDGTEEADARVPDRFREVQWTRLPGGATPPAFVERIRRLLAPIEDAVTSNAPESTFRTNTPRVPGAPATDLPPRRRPAPALLVVSALLFGAIRASFG